MESAGANAHEDKAIFHYEHRKELLAQAAKAVGATYGTTHSNYDHAPLTLRHRLRAILRIDAFGCHSCPRRPTVMGKRHQASPSRIVIILPS